MPPGFESKEVIYAAVLDWVFADFADAMEKVVGEISDPAEIIAVSTRYTIMRALREPVWGQFLVREGFSARSVDNGLGRRLLRDIRKGIATKRLNVADPLLSFVSVGGTHLGRYFRWFAVGVLHVASAAKRRVIADIPLWYAQSAPREC